MVFKTGMFPNLVGDSNKKNNFISCYQNIHMECISKHSIHLPLCKRCLTMNLRVSFPRDAELPHPEKLKGHRKKQIYKK